MGGRNSYSSLPCWGLEPGKSAGGRPDWFLEWCVPVARSRPASWMHQHKLRHEIKAVSQCWGGMAMFWMFHCKGFGKLLLLLICETCLFWASAKLGAMSLTIVWLTSDINIYKQVNIRGAATYPYCACTGTNAWCTLFNSSRVRNKNRPEICVWAINSQMTTLKSHD